MQQLAQPKIIVSPISGQPCRPQISTYIREGYKITEATYIDPSSGSFIRRVILSTEKVNPYKK